MENSVEEKVKFFDAFPEYSEWKEQHDGYGTIRDYYSWYYSRAQYILSKNYDMLKELEVTFDKQFIDKCTQF